MRNGLLPIGMFSRAACVSIKQLRVYHEMGLLVPAHVDPATGYRRYSDDQLADAAVIVRLRALDLPLDAVRRVIDARDPEHTAAVLATHRQRMQLRLAETERIVAELQSGLAPATHTPVHLVSEKPALTLRTSGAVTMEAIGPPCCHRTPSRGASASASCPRRSARCWCTPAPTRRSTRPTAPSAPGSPATPGTPRNPCASATS